MGADADTSDKNLLAVRDGVVREGDLVGVVVAGNLPRQREQATAVFAQGVDRFLIRIDGEGVKRFPQGAQTSDVIRMGMGDKDGEDGLPELPHHANGLVRVEGRPQSVDNDQSLRGLDPVKIDRAGVGRGVGSDPEGGRPLANRGRLAGRARRYTPNKCGGAQRRPDEPPTGHG